MEEVEKKLGMEVEKRKGLNSVFNDLLLEYKKA